MALQFANGSSFSLPSPRPPGPGITITRASGQQRVALMHSYTPTGGTGPGTHMEGPLKGKRKD